MSTADTTRSNTYPSLVGFDADLLPAIGGRYVTQDYKLFVRYCLLAAQSGSITLNFKQLLDDGRVVESSEVIGNLAVDTPTTVTFSLAKGYLLAAAATAYGTGAEHGELFVQIGLQYGSGNSALPSEILAQAYLTSDGGVWFPHGKNEQPGDGQGAVIQLSPTAPAPGANLQIPSFDSGTVKFSAVYFQLTTSAVVGNRNVRLKLPAEGVPDQIAAFSDVQQAASTTVLYSFFIGAALGHTAANAQAPLPAVITTPEGANAETDVLNLDAGDQITFLGGWFEAWAMLV